MTEISHLEQVIELLESQRDVLGNEAVDTALRPLHERLTAIQAQKSGTSMQRKLATVLFADVSGFTALVESMDPEDVTIAMNALWSRLDQAIIDEGGTIDKHIGDAVMALFGAPVAREDDPEHAIRAALAMQEQLERFIEAEDERTGGRFKHLKMRIGINTGLVLAGPVGTTQEYTALGDTVNTASRVEHAAPVGGVLITHDTYRHVRGIFELTPLEPITAKGKSEPIPVYKVDGIRPRSFRVTTRGVAGVETPTLGRNTELTKMRQAWEQAHTSAKVITVVADAGTGKSRLLHEFSIWLEAQPDDFRLFKGRSTEDMERLPYSLLRDLFAFQFEIHEGDKAAIARDKLEKGILSILGEKGEESIPFIGHLIGFDYSNNPYLSGIIGDARQVRDRAYHLIAQLLKSIMKEQPLMIFLEDLHWGDDGSLQLFEYLIDECQNDPLFIIALTRATLFDRQPSWGSNTAIHERIDLQPLAEDHIRQLVDIILQRAQSRPEALYSLIVTRADGNPFYVEEVIKMMIEEGVIDTNEMEWFIHEEKIDEFQVPATLTGVLQARLDGLPSYERQALQRASVVGRVFWDNVVAYLREDDNMPVPQQEVLINQLNHLQEKELVFERERSAFTEAQEYIFKHAILRDVTYESVLIQLRRVYHTQAANWLIERSGERINEFAGRIGEHYERAGEGLLAAEWYSKAGQQARTTYAGEAAENYYGRALALWEDSDSKLTDIASEMITAYEGLGKVLTWAGRFEDALETFIKMLSVAEEIDDSIAVARAWTELATAHMYSGDLRVALEDTEKAEQLAREENAQKELAAALQLQSWILLRLGEPEKARSLGEEALSVCKQLDNKEQIARNLNLLGGQQFMQGNYDLARQYLEEALEVFQAIDNKESVMDLYNNLGVIAGAKGDYHSAYGQFNSAVTMAREIGNRRAESQYISNRGSVSVELGNYEEAIADLRRVIDRTEGPGLELLSESYLNLAHAYLGLDEIEEALQAAKQAFELGQQVEAPDNIAEAWRVLGEIASQMEHPVFLDNDAGEALTAEECFSQSLEIFSDMGIEDQRARTLRAWARHELIYGDLDKGDAMWDEALEIFIRLDAQLEAERMADKPSPKA